MNTFLPSLFGHGCTPHKNVLYFLLIRMGGLNVRNPVTSSDHAYSASRSAVHLLVRSIIEQQPFCPIDHCFHIQHSKLEHSSLMMSINNDISDTVIKQFNKYHRAILRSKNTLSSWLSALPIQKNHFDLTANEFRDALCLQYMKPLLQLPPFCDGCSAPFTTTHALDCQKGIWCLNEIRDLLCDLSSMAWSNVTKVPVVTEPSSDSSGGGHIADIAVRGIWQHQSTALFDVCITDSNSPSYADMPTFDVLLSAKGKKEEVCCSM